MMNKTAKESITLAILQAELLWEDRQANLDFFTEQINSISQKVDLVVLPETFSTGFTMNVMQNADEQGETLNWMLNISAKKRMYIAGSIIVKENQKYYNRLYWVSPDGDVKYYNKHHLFRMGREHEHFTPGEERVIVKLGAFRILLQICYDLRFPVFARNRGDYDAILYVANWPSKRKEVWDVLLPARAIENQSFVFAANCCGMDGLGEGTCGASCVIDPRGNTEARLNDQPGILLSTIYPDDLYAFREKFPVHQDADNFSLH